MLMHLVMAIACLGRNLVQIISNVPQVSGSIRVVALRTAVDPLLLALIVSRMATAVGVHPKRNA